MQGYPRAASSEPLHNLSSGETRQGGTLSESHSVDSINSTRNAIPRLNGGGSECGSVVALTCVEARSRETVSQNSNVSSQEKLLQRPVGSLSYTRILRGGARSSRQDEGFAHGAGVHSSERLVRSGSASTRLVWSAKSPQCQQ